MDVTGMGESKTPKPFISACNQFKYLDILLSKEQSEENEIRKEETTAVEAVTTKAVAKASKNKKGTKAAGSAKKVKDELKPQTDLTMIKRAIISLVEECSDDDDGILSAELRNQLGKRFPDFDVRNFGHSKFSSFIKSLDILDCEQELNIVKFKMKQENSRK